MFVGWVTLNGFHPASGPVCPISSLVGILTLEKYRRKLILGPKIYSHHLDFSLAVSIHHLTQMEITVCPSLGRNILARRRSRHPAWDRPHVYYGSVLVS